MNKNENGKREGNEDERNKWTGNEIGDEGASKISESLKVNTTLTVLYLCGDEYELMKQKGYENERTK